MAIIKLGSGDCAIGNFINGNKELGIFIEKVMYHETIGSYLSDEQNKPLLDMERYEEDTNCIALCFSKKESVDVVIDALNYLKEQLDERVIEDDIEDTNNTINKLKEITNEKNCN